MWIVAAQEIKQCMTVFSAAYEEFDEQLLTEQVVRIKEISKENGFHELYEFCCGYEREINEKGFTGVYSKIQIFIHLVTEVVNGLDSNNA